MKRERATGSVRVAQVRKYSSYPQEDGWEVIPAWSRGKAPWKELSPFFLRVNGVIFENYWQSWKVYPSLGHIGEDGNPNQEWEEWHKKVVNSATPLRHPAGRAKPAYAWWEGQKLGLVEARRQIYLPVLEKLYSEHPVFHKLLEKVKSGQNVILVEPDGPDLGLFPTGVDMTEELIEKLMNVTDIKEFPHPEVEQHKDMLTPKYVPFGHGYVLAKLLLK